MTARVDASAAGAGVEALVRRVSEQGDEGRGQAGGGPLVVVLPIAEWERLGGRLDSTRASDASDELEVWMLPLSPGAAMGRWRNRRPRAPRRWSNTWSGQRPLLVRFSRRCGGSIGGDAERRTGGGRHGAERGGQCC